LLRHEDDDGVDALFDGGVLLKAKDPARLWRVERFGFTFSIARWLLRSREVFALRVDDGRTGINFFVPTELFMFEAIFCLKVLRKRSLS